MEIWKDIPNYEGLYKISNLGRVCSLSRQDSLGRNRKERLLHGSLNGRVNNKYLVVDITDINNSKKKRRIHVLVALCFLGPKPAGFVIDHKDRNKLNNNVNNSAYKTQSDNMKNTVGFPNKTSIYHGVHFRADNCKWVAQLICNGTRVYIGQFTTENEVAEAWNVCAYKHGFLLNEIKG